MHDFQVYEVMFLSCFVSLWCCTDFAALIGIYISVTFGLLMKGEEHHKEKEQEVVFLFLKERILTAYPCLSMYPITISVICLFDVYKLCRCDTLCPQTLQPGEDKREK